MCDIWLHFKALTSTDLQVTWKYLFINEYSEVKDINQQRVISQEKRMFQEGIVNSTQTFSEIKIKTVHWILYKFVMTFLFLILFFH